MGDMVHGKQGGVTWLPPFIRAVTGRWLGIFPQRLAPQQLEQEDSRIVDTYVGIKLIQSSVTQPRVMLSPGVVWKCLQVFLVVHNCGGVPGIRRVETRDTVKHSAVHRLAPQKPYPGHRGRNVEGRSHDLEKLKNSSVR